MPTALLASTFVSLTCLHRSIRTAATDCFQFGAISLSESGYVRRQATVPAGRAPSTGLLMRLQNEYFLRHISNDRDINSSSNETCRALTEGGYSPFDELSAKRTIIDVQRRCKDV